MEKSGTVVQHFTQNDKRHTVLRRSDSNLAKDPSKNEFFVVVHEGTKQNNKGQNQFFDRLEKTAYKYVSEKHGEMETYFQPTTSTKGTTSYVKSEKTSDGAEVRTEVTEKIPEKIGFELSPNVIGEIMGGAMNMLAYSAISNQIDTTEEMTKVAKGMTMVMIEAVDDIYKKYNK